MSNAFTVDLEDWAHGLLGGDTPITDRVVCNVDRVLELLAAHDVRATFFALGRVCEKFPELLPRIAAAGHEIGSHGYNHGLLFNMTPDEFRDDVRRSIDIIGEQVGVRPMGYRAPAFSITRRSLWAGPILAELGFEYSSSIFPFRGWRYGIAESPKYLFSWGDGRCERGTVPRNVESCVEVAGREASKPGGGAWFFRPCRGSRSGGRRPRADALGYDLSPLRGCLEGGDHLTTVGGGCSTAVGGDPATMVSGACPAGPIHGHESPAGMPVRPELVEFPLTTLQLFGRRFPACGGGYLRLLPAWLHAAAIRQANRAGQPAVIYMHPYELDVDEIGELRQQGWRFNRKTALMQSLFRSRVRPRLAHLLGKFHFAPMREVVRTA